MVIDAGGYDAGEVVRSHLFGQLDAEFEEARWLADYVAAGSVHGPPIVMSIGESWEGPPPELVAAIARAPRHLHGYLLAQHGLPRLRETLSCQLQADYGVSGPAWNALRVAVSWAGTRSAMFDFGRLLARDATDDRVPVVIAPAPGWDYAGIFEPLGYQTAFLDLDPADGFRPRETDLDRLIGKLARDPARRLALIVINAQHNPTGVDWGESFVTRAVELAADAGAGLLIDDAHHALYRPGGHPTAAVRLLCERLGPRRTARVPWLATRSLGKEFSCNGWALGSLAGSTRIIDRLTGEFFGQRQYSYSGALQWAMAEWLESGRAAGYLDERRRQLEKKRQLITGLVTDRLGYPADGLHTGPCSPFALLRLPPRYARRADGNREFRRQCFVATGVMLSDAWPLARAAGHRGSLPYARIFLGPPPWILAEAAERMARAGFTYE